MKKVKIMFLLGIWTAILPYLGFPYPIKNIIYSITGLAIIYVAYIFYKDLRVGETTEDKTFDNFSENSNFKEEKENLNTEINIDPDKEIK